MNIIKLVRAYYPDEHGKPRAIHVTLSWLHHDPHAVRFTFKGKNQDGISWIFSRELLSDGLATTTVVGEGDVRFAAADQAEYPLQVLLEISSPSGYAYFAFGIPDLQMFLSETEDIVPIGQEQDVFTDGVLRSFLEASDA